MDYNGINAALVNTISDLGIAPFFEETPKSLAATLVATLMEIHGEILENRATDLHMYAAGIREESRSEQAKQHCSGEEPTP
jgi:hypothetical protein